MVENLYKFKSDLDEQGVILCFSGVVSQEILSTFAEMIETKFESEGLSDMTAARNIFAIFVEMTHNIISYSSNSKLIGENKKQSPGVIIVGFDLHKMKFYIKSGNTVSAEAKTKIMERIDTVKNLDKEQLKALYKEHRKSGKNTHDRGGGLGFIEIQRKASEPLEYTFDKLDDNNLFFSVKATV